MNVQQPAVAGHRSHRAVKNFEARREKVEARERKERGAEEKWKGEIQVTKLYKPFGTTSRGLSPLGMSMYPFFQYPSYDVITLPLPQQSELYMLSDINAAFNAYVTTNQLCNPPEQRCINVCEDPALRSAVTDKNEQPPESLKREETLTRMKNHTQKIGVEGQDVIRKWVLLCPRLNSH